MYYEKKLEKEYVGKKITADLDELSSQNSDFDWSCNYSDDDDETELPSGEGHINLDYRPYLPEDYDDDDDDDEDDDEDEYDERRNWNLSTGIGFTVDEDGLLESIEITAEVSCFGDSGLGDCWPEDEWTDKDLDLAKKFLDEITA